MKNTNEKEVSIKKKPESVSIIIPIYNEENTLEEIIDKVNNATVHGLKKEIVLVDDCSKDSSRNILKRYEKIHKVIYQPINKGKGAALRVGFKHASGDIIIIQDADLEYDPGEYEKLLDPILKNKADVVFGSRFIGNEPHRVLYYRHYIGNKLLTTVSNFFTNLNLTDMETCYKVFKKEILNSITLETNRFGFEPEFTAKVSKSKYRIYEVGISYYGRSYEEGKHIGWKDAVSAVWYITKFNLLRPVKEKEKLKEK